MEGSIGPEIRQLTPRPVGDEPGAQRVKKTGVKGLKREFHPFTCLLSILPIQLFRGSTYVPGTTVKYDR